MSVNSNLSLTAFAFGNKKDAPVYISQDSGVVGLNFHQSKEVLINDCNGSNLGVSKLKNTKKKQKTKTKRLCKIIRNI